MSEPSGSPPGRSASGNSDNDIEYVGRGTRSHTQKRLASSSDFEEDWRNDTVGTCNMKFMDIELDFV
ncbi:hypothetical protein M422DRAFT_244306 [Sphaerobolus stellatus SS14]|nr:hypothetical protein M422DRAFT_244306 [Sphaerobolus stellatus SS14]